MIRVLGSNLALNSQRPGDPRADSTRAQAPPPSSRVGSRLPLVQGWESVAVAAPSSGRRPVFHFPLFCGRLPGGLRVQPIWVAPSPSRFAWNARVTLRSAGRGDAPQGVPGSAASLPAWEFRTDFTGKFWMQELPVSRAFGSPGRVTPGRKEVGCCDRRLDGLASACQDSCDLGPSRARDTGRAMSHDNVAIVRRMIDLANRREVEALGQLVAPDIE